MRELIGQTFAGYEILTQLGEGGMGVVYKARQQSPDRLVAIKIMSPHLSGDESFLSRFMREASTAARLRHPNMVLVHGAGAHEGIYHMVMELVEGETVLERIHRRGRLDPREALAITVLVAQALEYAWAKARLIHRDVKPANILLSNAGEVKLGDLGLAKSLGQSTAGTLAGTVLGSPHYMSPEQARAAREIDFRADIYSLGCTLYHMLTGRRPYEDCEPTEVMIQQISGPVPALVELWPQCPPAVDHLLQRMLAKPPQQRHQSYAELLRELKGVHGQLKAAAKRLQQGTTMALPESNQAAPPTPLGAAALDRPETTEPKNRSSALTYALLLGGAVALAAGLRWWAPWNRGEFAPGGQTAAVPAPSDPVWTNAVSLLPLIDPTRDAVRGEWHWQSGALSSDSETAAALEVPYEPSTEYDFRIDFNCPERPGPLCQILFQRGHTFCWVIDPKSNGLTGFEGLAAAGLSNGPSPAVLTTHIWQSNQTHVCVVAVRKHHLRAFLDGQLLAEGKDDYSPEDVRSRWKLRTDGVLGLGSDGSPVMFKKVLVREVTGKGTVTRARFQ